MIDLSSYTVSHLQSVRSVLQRAHRDAIDLTILLEVIENDIAAITGAGLLPSRSEPPAPEACPGCGSILGRVDNREGLYIMGCRKCRYSRIEDRI